MVRSITIALNKVGVPVAVVLRRRWQSFLATISLVAFALVFGQGSSSADESGASFWSPGTFANLAAVPGEPGWSFSATYFHTTLMGGSNVATADTLPRFPRTTLTVQLDADIKTNVDLAILTPAYTFATPVWGGRLGFNLFIPVGTARTQIDALVTGALGPIGFATQNSISDRLTSFGDPAPQLSLKWNEGANNFMVYSRGGVPIGDYDPDRIVNLGDGHASWDNGIARPEIHVHLHLHQKRAGIVQINQDLVHAKVRRIIGRLWRTNTCRPNHRRNGGNCAGELAAADGIGVDHDLASCRDLADVAFVEFRTHAQRRQIAEPHEWLRSGRHRHLANLGMDL